MEWGNNLISILLVTAFHVTALLNYFYSCLATEYLNYFFTSDFFFLQLELNRMSLRTTASN